MLPPESYSAGPETRRPNAIRKISVKHIVVPISSESGEVRNTQEILVERRIDVVVIHALRLHGRGCGETVAGGRRVLVFWEALKQLDNSVHTRPLFRRQRHTCASDLDQHCELSMRYRLSQIFVHYFEFQTSSSQRSHLPQQKMVRVF